MKRMAIAVIAASVLIAAAPNWTTTVRQAPNGAFVMGNPAAKAKLVEYLSYTCGHCAHFAAESKALKTNYVAKGMVSVEFRNAVRDPYDFAAALLARCGGASKFFANSDAIMAAQPQWLSKANGFARANAERLSKLPINDSLKAIARGVGLDAVMKARGYTIAQIDACLTSKPDQQKIAGMRNEAWTARQLTGTPSFLVNDRLAANTSDWAALEPKLKAAIAAK
jgi:protein-disulfide isomerase